MTILVTGGAGYIGSVMVDQLIERGEQVVVLDEVARGHQQAVDESVPFYKGSTGDLELVGRICRERDIEACIHFAALAYVGESVAEPRLYFENNAAQGSACSVHCSTWACGVSSSPPPAPPTASRSTSPLTNSTRSNRRTLTAGPNSSWKRFSRHTTTPTA